MTILEPVTLFPSRSEAEWCADANNREPDGWLYRAVRVPGGWHVAAYDEEGELVGYL
jgi:hypothetical protein